MDRLYTQTWFKHRIEEATTDDILTRIRDQIETAGLRWKQRGLPDIETLAAVNDWHERLFRQVLTLVQADMLTDGHGPAPAPWCWLLLGSGGRREMTLGPDQDHALLHEGTPEQLPWFRELAARVSMRLRLIGYPYCSGFVMAANERWNLTFTGWQEQVRAYLDFPDWDSARYLTMAADLRPLAGDLALGHRLADWIAEQLRERPFLHWIIADRAADRRVALDLLDRFRVDLTGEQIGQLNLKEGGYLQLVSLVRLWALACGARGEPSTSARLAQLRQRGVWEERWHDEVLAAHQLLSGLRLWGNYVRPDDLTPTERYQLKHACQVVKRLQKKSIRHFRKP